MLNRLTKLTYFDGTSASYTYTPTGQQATVVDGRGNLTQISAGSSVTTYTYDAADRLVSATEPNGSSASYVYDADERRVHFNPRQ